MKYQNTNNPARAYVAPSSELVQIATESFMMMSSLEDYDDNPIFGSPTMDVTMPENEILL